MKKIAKGVTLLLITLFLLMTTSTICTAADMESKISQDNFTIENSLGRDYLKCYVEDNVFYIENQSSKELDELVITVTINDDVNSVTTDKISGFSTYSLNLTDCFSEDYINENNVNIVVNYYNMATAVSATMFWLACYAVAIVIIITLTLLIYLTRNKRCR